MLLSDIGRRPKTLPDLVDFLSQKRTEDSLLAAVSRYTMAARWKLKVVELAQMCFSKIWQYFFRVFNKKCTIVFYSPKIKMFILKL